MREIKKHNCLVVLGPTASGKTRLACQIASQLNGEIISADSRQVYRGLDAGTGKDLVEYTVAGKQIPYHLINVADAGTKFYLHDFMRQMKKAFDDIRGRDRLPVICGGTGMYLDALRKDFSNTQVPENPSLRAELENADKQDLLARLNQFPRAHIAQVDKTSVKRVIRGIEIASFLASNELKPGEPLPYAPFYVGIAPERTRIIENIAARLDARLPAMIVETRRLLAEGISHDRLRELGLEYRFMSMYLRDELTFEEAREKLIIAIRQFARRQMTWFRRMEREGVVIHWQTSPELTPELNAMLRDIFEP